MNEKLTERELSVVRLVAKGKTTAGDRTAVRVLALDVFGRIGHRHDEAHAGQCGTRQGRSRVPKHVEVGVCVCNGGTDERDVERVHEAHRQHEPAVARRHRVRPRHDVADVILGHVERHDRRAAAGRAPTPPRKRMPAQCPLR